MGQAQQDDVPRISNYARKRMQIESGERKPFEFVDVAKPVVCAAQPAGSLYGRIRVTIVKVTARADFSFLKAADGRDLYVNIGTLRRDARDVEIVSGSKVDCDVEPPRTGKSPQITRIYGVTNRT